jgi:glycogen synthase
MGQPSDATGQRRGPHVLRLASVFEPRPADAVGNPSGFDQVGGMQVHTATLTRHLDAVGVRQLVVTSRLAGPRCRERVGRRSVVVRVGLRTTRLRQFWALAALRHILRPADAVDLVHVHQGEDLAVLPLGWLASRRLRCPLVVTVHCSVRHTVDARTPRAFVLHHVGGRIERWVVRRADAVVVLTRRTADRLTADGVPASRIRVITPGFDPELFGSKLGDAFEGLPRPRVGFVGRLAPQKNPHFVVSIFERLTSDAYLVIVGDGPQCREVEEQVRRSSARERILLYGPADHRDIPSIMHSIDVLILPSQYEELGTVLIEAMASGVPALAAQVGGIPEVVVDGSTGVLAPPGDEPAWAAALNTLLADPVRRKRLGKDAAERAKGYTWPVLAGRIRQVYDDLLPPDQS